MKLANSIALLSVILSFSASADITVIESTISGKAIKMDEGVINIINPTIEMDGKEYFLFGSADYDRAHITAIYACKKLNMKFVGLTSTYLPTQGDSFRVNENGVIAINDGSKGVIETLACKQ